MRIISLGGGIQSTVLCLMAFAGLIKCDAIVFADTGSEMPHTYATIQQLSAMAADAGIPFFIVSNHGKKLHEEYMKNETLPMVGISSCTINFKISPIRRWLRANQDESGEKPWSTVLLGITTDEANRVRKSDLLWVENEFPLVDMGMSRQDCIKYLEDFPELSVKKSGCFMCMYQPAKSWVNLKVNEPKLFDVAMMMEKIAREGKHELKAGLFGRQSIERFNFSHTLDDFGFQFDPVDFDCNASGGCFL